MISRRLKQKRQLRHSFQDRSSSSRHWNQEQINQLLAWKTLRTEAETAQEQLSYNFTSPNKIKLSSTSAGAYCCINFCMRKKELAAAPDNVTRGRRTRYIYCQFFRDWSTLNKDVKIITLVVIWERERARKALGPQLITYNPGESSKFPALEPTKVPCELYDLFIINCNNCAKKNCWFL
jgi:hypothetical protein